MSDFKENSAIYWHEQVIPAVSEYMDAYNRLGADMLERNYIKPVGISSVDWLLEKLHQQSIWEKNRQIQKTGIQSLSQKNLWPTKDEGAGEALRKSMLKAVKTLKKAPHTNSVWLRDLYKIGDL